MLAKISIGWVWLERTLNGIIDVVNQQKPLGSASIAIEESPNGTLLKVVPVAQSDQTIGGGGGGGGGATGGGTGGGGAVTWNNVGWQQVIVVDPANNCAQSTIKVLVFQQGSSVTIN